jgi:UDP-N-acetyl-D-galactosamine dehydrogenase
MKQELKSLKLAVVGLGYVGLPLAVEFSKKRSVVAYDINENRISDLMNGIDVTLEISSEELSSLGNINFTSNYEDLKHCNCYIITVPTPIDKYKQPDLGPLLSASKLVGSLLKKGDIVIYESTVFPGATEEECVPVIENESNLVYNHDFFVGYSPERINPGDKEHKLTNITKITSGSNQKTAEIIDCLYNEIITVGTYKASSIKVAEAAKVIENTQRDLNIALINELSIIFNHLDIDTTEVLNAASTKWNFLPFKPGLVGGHCIGVDPYYLTHKAQSIGYHPEIILAGRRLNDSMGKYIVGQLFKEMTKRKIQIVDSNVLVLGLTFKENCPDLRNTKVIDIINELKLHNCNVDVFDPWVNSVAAEKEYQIPIEDNFLNKKYDSIIFAVAHKEFMDLSEVQINSFRKKNSVLYDLKNILNGVKADLKM